MPLYFKHLTIIATIGAVLGATGCYPTASYDNPYQDYQYDNRRQSDGNSAYQQGYRDAERQNLNRSYNSRDHDKAYERGRKEAEREAKERYREREREDYRRSHDYRRPGDYPVPGGSGGPHDPPRAPGTFNINDN